MFSPETFHKIPTKAEQFTAVLQYGTLADERFIYGKYEIKIYSLSDFFVEVWTDLKSNEIERIEVLDKEEAWSGFLESVKLKALF